MRRHLLPLACVAILALVGMGPLFVPGYWKTHDGHHQVIRLMHFHRGLADGQFPVRWAGSALCGYGYPLFVFTYRLPFWLAEAWYLLSGSLTGSIKATVVGTFLASGLTMYWFAHLLTASRVAACTAAILYLWAPYRFLDVYVRGALGEAVAFTFVPLLYGCLYRMAHDTARRRRWSIGAAIAAACLVLSHMMIVALFAIPVALWWVHLWREADDQPRFVGASLHAGAVALSLTAYYWLPAALEKSYTQFAGRLGDYYADHFLEFSQLVRSPWGFGFDQVGARFDEMSFELGAAQWVVVLASATLLAALAWRRRERDTQRLLAVLLATFAASVYFALPQGGWLYEVLRHAVVVDLPWKWLSVSVFCIATLVAVVLTQLRERPRLQASVAALLVALALYGNRDHVRVGGRDGSPDVAYWTNQSTSNDYGEYTPVGFDPDTCSADAPTFVLLSGAGDTELLDRRSNAVEFIADVTSPVAVIAAKTLWYPGWRAQIDGSPAPLGRDGGRITVRVSRGHHVIELSFGETGSRRVADAASLAAMLYVVVALGRRRRRPRSA